MGKLSKQYDDNEKKTNSLCIKSICVEKSSYKITKRLLEELYDNAKKAKQTPYLELLIKDQDNQYYKLSCNVEKITL